jgi:hypothetical protein
MTIGLATQSKAHRRAERGLDLYETPPVAVRALLKVERIPHKVWEPAAGNGSIVRSLLLRLVFLEAGNPRTEAGRAPRFWLDEHPPARVQIFSNRFLANIRAIHHAKTGSASDRAPQAEPEGRS